MLLALAASGAEMNPRKGGSEALHFGDSVLNPKERRMTHHQQPDTRAAFVQQEPWSDETPSSWNELLELF